MNDETGNEKMKIGDEVYVVYKTDSMDEYAIKEKGKIVERIHRKSVGDYYLKIKFPCGDYFEIVEGPGFIFKTREEAEARVKELNTCSSSVGQLDNSV